MPDSLSHFAKKSLGQNFLKSERALSDIVIAGDVQAGELIIEIGPGKGALTTKLLEKIKEINTTKPESNTRLVCIEKDDRLIPLLEETYRDEIQTGLIQIIHGDIIEILNNKEQIGLIVGKNSHYKIIANIPYYITGLIFRGIFELNHLPQKIVLLVQKEVANRIMAYGDNGQTNNGNGKESILSISIKLYGTPRRVGVVPRGAFVPAPTVDSAIIAVEKIERKIPQDKDLLFFDMIHAAFSHKRKRLVKNLESFYEKVRNTEGINKNEVSGKNKNNIVKNTVNNSDTINKKTSQHIEEVLFTLNLDKNVRAEDISIETYIQLFERLI